MIKTVKQFVLSLLWGPEFVIVLVGWAGWRYARPQIESFAKALPPNTEALRYLAILPVGLFVWLLKDGKEILFPKGSGESKYLLQWPEYWRLKIVFVVSLVYGFLFASAGMLVWILGWKLNEAKGLSMLVLSLMGELTVSGTVYFAKLKEKEILTKFLG